MKTLRIQGLVKVANTIRRELSGALSPSRKAHLQATVANSLQAVDRIVAQHGVSIDHLPTPTRRAYHFLASLDFDAIALPAPGESSVSVRRDVSLVGLKSYLNNMLTQLAKPLSAEKGIELHDAVRSASDNIEEYLQANDLEAKNLTAQSRAIRGWLVYFSARENFDAYLAAINRARPAFESTIRDSERFSPPAMIEFRLTSGLYRIRSYSNATRVVLAAPMICFTDELFTNLARAAIRGGLKQPIMEATSSEKYQGIQAELEALSGVQEQTAGVHRDLAASFQRIAEKYFDGTLLRPRLSWSKAFTGRKFGHYDPVRDTVMISCTLDRADVPEFVLDSVMHHELLHKKLGVGFRGGRMSVHPPEFRKEERRFVRFEEADSLLRKLASET